MKGVILAGGQNSRLNPLTRGVPKCLLPVYNRTMVDCAIEALRIAGVQEVLIVTDRAFAGNFVSHLGISAANRLKRLEFTTAPTHWEAPRALCEAEAFVGDDNLCLMFGDNIFAHSIRNQVSSFNKQLEGARVLLARVDNPQEYGVAIIDDGKLTRIVEKPGNWDSNYAGPISNLAVTGCYFYPPSIFKIIPLLQPTVRPEPIISDLNNYFLSKGLLEYGVIPGGWWDAGESVERYNQVCRIVQEVGVNKVKGRGRRFAFKR